MWSVVESLAARRWPLSDTGLSFQQSDEPVLMVGGGVRWSQQIEDAQMKQILVAFAAALVSSTFALADTPVTPAEGEKITAALEAFGCTGGKMEKETEGSGYFEVDDAKCNWAGSTTSSSTRTSR